MKLAGVFIKKKLRDRMFIVSSEQLLNSGLFASSADYPALLGGSYPDSEQDFFAWLDSKLARRAQTIAAVTV